MRQKNIFLILGLFSALSVQSAFAQTVQNLSVSEGPKTGSLVIVGGGALPDTVVNRFIELAGGKDAPIVVIPTAAGSPAYNDSTLDFLRRRGATNVTLLHTYDTTVANQDEFIKPLVTAQGVWFGGGRQWRLVDAYKNTTVEKLLWDVLHRGGVIGGTSAGATIQGSFLVRGDTKDNQTMMGDHQEGFGYLRNTAIDQHVLARNRHFDLFEVIRKKPELLGIGIDESTAIVVQGNEFQVIGNQYVIIYDGSFWSREGSDQKKLPNKESLFYFLRAGDKYDLLNRKTIRQ
jgi:cyanophycinase